jgi:hypothetical protein
VGASPHLDGAVLVKQGLVKLERVAQDGMRTRPSAGAASFRRGAKLNRFVEEAEQQIALLRRGLDEDPAASPDWQKRAQRRAAKDCQQRPSRRPGADRYARKYADTERTFRWRTRMAEERSQRIYRQRAATAETVNADLRCRTLSRFTVRGRTKVRAVALLPALTYNLLRAARLRAPN